MFRNSCILTSYTWYQHHGSDGLLRGKIQSITKRTAYAWVTKYQNKAKISNLNYRSFSLSRNKKINWKPSSGGSQVSGLCRPQFLSYLPKRFTHLCRALYGDAIMVHRFSAPIWPPQINKNIWSLLFLYKGSLFSHENKHTCT